MRKGLLVFVAVGAVCAGSLQAASISYIGKLTGLGGSGDGSLFVTGFNWVSSETSLSWKVDNTTTPGMWHYEYTLNVPNKGGQAADIQRVIIEASDGSSGPAFTSENLHSATSSPADWIQSVEVGLQRPSDNPNLPRNLYGIELTTINIDPKLLTISFDTDRTPVWGDFYARSYVVNGDFCAFYNWGLLKTPESDPTDAPGNGSIRDHVLVPDSTSIVAVVPAPAAMLLGVLGVPLAGWLKRAQRL